MTTTQGKRATYKQRYQDGDEGVVRQNSSLSV
jgi:hypothetical protein